MPLHLAVKNSRENIVRILLTENIDIEQKDSEGRTAFWIAIDSKNGEIARMLLQKKASAHCPDATGRTPMHCATQSGNMEMIELLLSENVSVTTRDKAGITPLHHAADREIANALLKAGAHPNTPDNEGYYPLYRAAAGGHKTIVELLLSVKAICNAQNGPMNATALHIAAQRGDAEMVRLLIASRAEVNVLTKSRMTPLFLAVHAGYEAVARILLINGARLSSATTNGTQALHVAAKNGHVDIAKNLLLPAGAEVNAQNHRGETPLHQAAGKHRNEFARLLLNRGADVDLMDCDGKTALWIATHEGNEELAQILLQAGANPNIAEFKTKRSPMFVAAEQDHPEIAKLIILYRKRGSSTQANDSRAMHIAAKRGHEKIIAILLRNNVSAKCRTTGAEGRHTPFLLAVENRHLSATKRLLKNSRTDIEARLIGGAKHRARCALHVAAAQNDPEMAKFLLDNRASFQAYDWDGHTALHIATEQGAESVIALLLERGCPVDQLTKKNETALHLATKQNNEAIVRLLLDNNASFQAYDYAGKTALHLATEQGAESVIALLLGRGCPVDQLTTKNETALYLAAKSNHPTVVRLLLIYGANTNQPTQAGVTALHIASGHANGREAVRILLEADGADINIRDRAGHTPLHYAAHFACNDTVQLLLTMGAEPNVFNAKKRESALYHAIHRYSQCHNDFFFKNVDLPMNSDNDNISQRLSVAQSLLNEGTNIDDNNTIRSLVRCKMPLPLLLFCLDRGATMSPEIKQALREINNYQQLQSVAICVKNRLQAINEWYHEYLMDRKNLPKEIALLVLEMGLNEEQFNKLHNKITQEQMAVLKWRNSIKEDEADPNPRPKKRLRL